MTDRSTTPNELRFTLEKWAERFYPDPIHQAALVERVILAASTLDSLAFADDIEVELVRIMKRIVEEQDV